MNLKKLIVNTDNEVVEATYNFGKDSLSITSSMDTVFHTRYFLLNKDGALWVKSAEKKFIKGKIIYNSYYDFDSKESVLSWEEFYRYDNQQKLTHQNSPNSPFKATRYIYNEKGLIIKCKYKLYRGFRSMESKKTKFKYKHFKA